MKNINKFLVTVALGSMMAACAEQDVENYYVDKPQSIADQEWLLEYGNIKDYVDRAKYPNFKIACALGAADYSARGVVYRVANANFDEITLGNAMKYASVVQDDGSMEFGTVETLLDDATAAGMSVYGHTLAWHAQQNTTYLNNCLGDIAIPSYTINDFTVDFSQIDFFPFTPINGYSPQIVDGIMVANKKNSKFYIAEDIPTVPGETYNVNVSVLSSEEYMMTIIYGPGADDKVTLALAPEWMTKKFSFKATQSSTSFRVDVSRQAPTLSFQSVDVSHNTPSSRPQEQYEKVDTIHRALYKWIDGMMHACNGRVLAWDMINEAISGGDSDGDGWYDLQTAATGSASDFFWQDWTGHEQYGAVVSKYAREAFARYGGNPADLKLFVNDYNLESDWDDNKKLKSMIHWIEVWERNGAIIDGVSSQMHISYYENKATMRSKAKHMVNMLHLMANTGKLVRISELDMGYVDINGNDLKPEDMNNEQKQNMANYYRFIIQMFLQIVPVNQQYSICQWCLTDAPANSGWRANSPVGLWDLNWNRKPAYAGYCDAFIKAIPATEDFFEYLEQQGLTHYIYTAPAVE